VRLQAASLARRSLWYDVQSGADRRSRLVVVLLRVRVHNGAWSRSRWDVGLPLLVQSTARLKVLALDLVVDVLDGAARESRERVARRHRDSSDGLQVFLHGSQSGVSASLDLVRVLALPDSNLPQSDDLASELGFAGLSSGESNAQVAELRTDLPWWVWSSSSASGGAGRAGRAARHW
jgi:hypothetical protein